MAKVAGSIWVEGNDLHYVDYFNREWYSPGFFVKAVSGAVPGSLWQDSGTTAGIYWVNEAGNGIYRTPVNFSKLIGVGPPITSLWVEQSNNFLSWLWYHSGGNYQIFNNHWDVAQVNTHGDAHTDGAHTDVPHSDVPHTDVPSSQNHNDYHNDVPHADFWDSSHGDTARVNFGDHVDCLRTFDNPFLTVHMDCYSSPYGGSDPNPYGPIHTDYFHYDSGGGNQGSPEHPTGYADYSQHWDFAHEDTHSDSPHQDAPPWIHHGDYWDVAGHQDVAHSDSHSDAAHQDVHTDTHGDVPHTDQPVLIGP